MSTPTIYESDWRRFGEKDTHGQMSSGPRGLFYAVASMRRGITEGTLTEARVTEHDTGRVIYDPANGIDEGPRCERCTGPYCADPSGHFTE